MSKPAYFVKIKVAERDGKGIWTEIGAGWLNKDGSIGLRLHAVPIDRDTPIVLFPPRDPDESRQD
jgi:hypothetical protein